MPLITEDGTGLSDSESYASVSYADIYHYNRGNSDWAALVTSVIEQYLRKSTDYLLQKYRASWKGFRLLDTQALDWPRDGVYIDNAVLVADDVVPIEVQRSCCELALRNTDGELLEDSGGRLTTKAKVDVIEVEYSEQSTMNADTKYNSIDKMLQPYLDSSSVAGIMGRIDRA